MKKLICILAFSAISSFAQGTQYFATNNLAATNNLLMLGAKYIESITLTTTNTSSTLVYLYDGNITNITAAYTNYISYRTNVITSTPNPGGTTNLMTNTVLWYAPVANAAATNNTLPTIVLAVNPVALGATQYTPSRPLAFINRLTLSNNAAGLNAIIAYHNP